MKSTSKRNAPSIGSQIAQTLKAQARPREKRTLRHYRFPASMTAALQQESAQVGKSMTRVLEIAFAFYVSGNQANLEKA